MIDVFPLLVIIEIRQVIVEINENVKLNTVDSIIEARAPIERRYDILIIELTKVLLFIFFEYFLLSHK